MTVKTQGGKVITKGGKVSCECCGGEGDYCCLYHVNALDTGLISVADLPDEIVYKIPFFGNVILFKGVWAFGEYKDAAISGAFFGRPEEDFEDTVIYYGPDSNTEGWRGGAGIDTPPGMCLITEDGETEDLFADTYSVSGPINGIVTRVSLCVWEGDQLKLIYDGRTVDFGEPGAPFFGSYKWRLNGNNKSGFQNTPVGSYAGGFTVS
jgi:hypothetical protein